MKTTEIVGFRREDLGTKFSKALRADGNVPSVLYGGEEVIHFHAPAYLFNDLLYTPDAYIVQLNVEGVEKKCVLKDVQFHPVSDMILHVDFLEIFDDKAVVVEIPVRTVGTSPGILGGGQLFMKSRKLKAKALPSQLPEYIEVDISGLELGSSLKVGEITVEGYEIVNSPSTAIAQVIVPRALKAQSADATEEVEGAAEE